jgi:hypothetical protein
MIINIIQKSVSNTQGVRPTENKTLFQTASDCRVETGKKDNTLKLVLYPQLKLVSMYSDEEYIVFHSQIEYYVVTDGSLTTDDLYSVFEKGFNVCINAYLLSRQHLNDSMDKQYKCPPLDYFQDKFEEILEWFLQSSH